MEKNGAPLVTVIITSFNHAQYILQTIESVKAQTYPNWELIVIDDGSTDNTHEVLRSMPEDKRVRLILNTDNKRQSARLNQAIALAKGTYISLLSSDDWYLPEKLEQQVALFEKLDDEYGVVYSGGYRYYEDTGETIEINSNKSMKRGWILKELLTEPFFIYPISPLIRKKCFERYPFDESYTAEGEAIYFKIAMHYKYDFVPELLVTMRDHSYNIGGNIERMLSDNIRYRGELFKHPDFPNELLALRNKVLSEIYKLKGWEYIRLRGEYAIGREVLLKAVKEDVRLIIDGRVLLGLVLSILPSVVADFVNKKKR